MYSTYITSRTANEEDRVDHENPSRRGLPTSQPAAGVTKTGSAPVTMAHSPPPMYSPEARESTSCEKYDEERHLRLSTKRGRAP